MPEEIKDNPSVKPEEPSKEPAKEEPKPAPEEDTKFKELSDRLETIEGKNEELEGKNEVLQDSLDTALEEMVLRSQDPEANPVEGETKEVPKDNPAPVETPKESVEIEKEIEKSIKEDSEVRGKMQEELEGLLTREAVTKLEVEMGSALTEFPKASKEEILLAVEDGTDMSIKELAEASHLRRAAELDKFKESNIEEYKAQLKKEEEGGISIPQSPGSPEAPVTPVAPGAVPQSPSQIRSGDDEWGSALDKAKVEGGGV